MAWTAPRTWTTGEVVTAAIMNTHVRDDLLETAPGKASAAGDLFIGTGANAIKRLALGATPLSFPRVNAGGTDVEWSGYVPVNKAGDTMTGPITMNTDTVGHVNLQTVAVDGSVNVALNLIKTAIKGWAIGNKTIGGLHKFTINTDTDFAGVDAFTIEPDGSAASINGNTVMHAGNVGTYALPISGGILTDALHFDDVNKEIDALGDQLQLKSLLGAIFVSSKTGSSINHNAYFTGAGWDRYDTGAGAIHVATDPINGTIAIYTVGAGANPIVWNGPYTVWHAGNDGTGSGLDADKLDGNEAAAFLLLTGGTMTGALAFQSADPNIIFKETGVTADNGNWDFYFNGERFDFRLINDALTVTALIMRVERTGTTVDTVNFPNGTLQAGGNTVWHAGNDGTGSGLDADTTDTYHANNTASNIPVLTAGGALQAPGGVGASGTWSDTTTAVTANGTYTKQIALGYAATKGRLIARGSSFASGSVSIYDGAIVWFGTNSANTHALIQAQNVDGTVITKFINGADLRYITTHEADPSNRQFGDDIYIKTVSINGTNLEIVFDNTDSDTDRTLNVSLYWEVD